MGNEQDTGNGIDLSAIGLGVGIFEQGAGGGEKSDKDTNNDIQKTKEPIDDKTVNNGASDEGADEGAKVDEPKTEVKTEEDDAQTAQAELERLKRQNDELTRALKDKRVEKARKIADLEEQVKELAGLKAQLAETKPVDDDVLDDDIKQAVKQVASEALQDKITALEKAITDMAALLEQRERKDMFLQAHTAAVTQYGDLYVEAKKTVEKALEEGKLDDRIFKDEDSPIEVIMKTTYGLNWEKVVAEKAKAVGGNGNGKLPPKTIQSLSVAGGGGNVKREPTVHEVMEAAIGRL